MAGLQQKAQDCANRIMMGVTCPPLASITPLGALVHALLLLHIDLLAWPGLIWCPFFSSGLNAPPKTGLRRLQRPAAGSFTIIGAQFKRTGRERGGESDAEEGGEHGQGCAEHVSRAGFRVQKRDDMASPRTRSAHPSPCPTAN